MKPRSASRGFGLRAAALVVVSCSTVAMADDSEIFTGSAKTAVAPNILFILDTSGSMSTAVATVAPYDPGTTYPGSCSSSLVYYQGAGGATPTGCSGLNSFSTSNQKCQVGAPALATGGAATGPGFYTDTFVQWRLQSTKYFWSSTLGASGGTDVACKGDFDSGTSPYPTNTNSTSNSSSAEWTSSKTASNSYWNGGGGGSSYTLYSGNYLNYQANPTPATGTRISVVQQAATNLIESLSNVNIGLMRYSNNDGGSTDASAAGGMVAYPVSPVATNKKNLVSTLNSYSAGGWTPLSETLYEAYLYYSGGQVNFGNSSKPFLSVDASRVGGSGGTQYQTPVTNACQKNFIVYLTDGLPTQDNQADSLITKLPNEATLGGACDNTSKSPYTGFDANGVAIPGGWGPSQTAGKCMAPLAKYMNSTDMFTTPAMTGQQNVQLYAIGFGNDPALAAAASWLGKAATAGGGQFYQASDLNGLQTALTNIVNNILTTSSTFSAPAVPVNAFNPTQTLNDLYLSVFQPGLNYHWPGNVKKYSLVNGVIVDQNGAAAVDPTTGTFLNSAESIWSTRVDGSKVTAGGAANQLPDWNPSSTPKRNLYTYIGANNPGAAVDLTSSATHAVTTTNTAITNAVLGVPTTAVHDSVINYARGEDLKDENTNGITNEPRHAMGDPLHSQPAVVIYGGTPTTPNVNDAALFVATNDGFLHSFDVTNGHELWAFIPQEKLPDLNSLYVNSPTSPKHYSLDGNIRVLKYDINGDGIVDPAAGDRVLLFVGDGRGGSTYYAFDVTTKATPKYLWAIDASTAGMSGIGATWSTPAITRVNIGGATQNSQKFVLVFGGGYDTAEESTVYQTSDGSGNGVYMVDALYGTVLWSAGPTGVLPAPTLSLARMDHAIPSDVTVMDLDGDGYADRMYVGDMAGQLWRFDIYNGNSVSGLVTGGVIASLGTHDDSSHTAAATRRFYNAPDVAAIDTRASPSYFNVAIGSGYRGHPLDTTAQDRFYSIRDYNSFTKLTQAQYAALTVVHDSDSTLVDITTSVQPTIPSGAEGWKLLLDQPGGSWVGEKVLTTSTTFQDDILFVTYTPSTGASSNPCAPSVGTNRVYAISVFDGSPVANLNNQNNTAITDRSETVNESGIAPPVSVLFTAACTGANCPQTPPCPAGTTCPPPPCTGLNCPTPPVCAIGNVVVAGVCKSFNSRVKTVWSEKDAN